MNRIDLAKWLASHTRQLLGPLTISVFARIVGQLLGVALFVTAAHTIVTASPANSAPLWIPVVLLAAFALGKAALRYLEHYAGHWVAFTSLQRLRELFFARLIPQVPAATSGRAGAELTARATSDIDRIETFFAHTFPPAIASVVVPAVALTWLGLSVNAPLALTLAAFVVAATIALPLLTSRGTWKRAGLVARQRGEIAERVGDDVQGTREVLAFGIEENRIAALAAADDGLGAERSRAGRQHGYRATAMLALQLGGLVALPIVGAATGASAAEVAVALAAGIALWAPVQGIDGFAAGLDSAFAAAARIREVIDGEPAVRDGGGATRSVTVPTDMSEADARRSRSASGAENDDTAGNADTSCSDSERETRGDGERSLPSADSGTALIAVDRVTFRYRPERLTLDDVSAEFAAGEWSYVLGVSGSGKSTLARLFVRGWDPESGTIRLGDVDVRELSLDELRRRIAYVSQRPTMLSGTIAENLRLSAPSAPDSEIQAALADVRLDAWVAILPAGIETPLAEHGLDISGGQLQRLALARALVAEPKVLVLDEALSQLDAETARAVRERIAARAVTIIELTHRADLVPGGAAAVVLDAGRVVERGRADALRATPGAFTRLEARV